MKNYTFLLLLFIGLLDNLSGQAVPGYFNYQLAIRDAEGRIIKNRLMSFNIYITDSPSESNPNKFIFNETHQNILTSSAGIVSFQIGAGKKVQNSNDLEKVSFLGQKLYINVAVDTNNGSNYNLISSTQLISVPYAFVADSSNFALKANDLTRRGAQNDQVLKWNDARNSWIPSDDIGGTNGDGWGTQTVQRNSTLDGDGTLTSPLGLAQQGAKNGQVLKWDSLAITWIPSDDNSGTKGDGWGSQIVLKDLTLKGDGTSISPLGLAQQGAKNGQVLKWDSIAITWIPSDDNSGTKGDGWGTQTVQRNSTLNGDGTTNSPLGLASQNANAGQVLKWNGSSWIPANDSIGVNSGSNWSLNGNNVNGSNFIGSTNNIPLRFKVNNVFAGVIGGTQTSIGIGTNIGNGISNSCLGYNALNANTAGTANCAFGVEALSKNLGGNRNTAIGYQCLYNNQGDFNEAFGAEALFNNISGSNNTAIGTSSLKNNVTGYQNVAIGLSSLYNNKKGYYNVAIGSYTSWPPDSCTYLTAIGAGAGAQSINVSASTAIGAEANVRNDSSTAIGARAAAFGYRSTAIGAGSVVTTDNTIMLGNMNTAKLLCKVPLMTTSDKRFKENVKDNIPGLSFINKLRPISYTMNNDKLMHHLTAQMPDSLAMRYYPTDDQIRYDRQKINSGFMAQEVEQIAQDIGYDFDGVSIPQNETDTYSIAYSQFVPSIVKAIQEQQVMIESQNKAISILEAKLNKMEQLQDLLLTLQLELKQLKESK